VVDRRLEYFRFVGVLPVSISWFSFTGDFTDSLVCAVVSHGGAVGFLTSLVVGCLFPVAVGGAAYRKFVSLTKAVDAAASEPEERCSRRHSSVMRLQITATQKSPRRFSSDSFSVLAKRLAGKNVSETAYFV